MRPRILAFTTEFLLILASAAQAQFFGLPLYDQGIKLNSYVQADINQDGKTDIVAIRYGGPTGLQITSLLGNGTGGFGAPLNSPIAGISNSPYGQFLLADFNGDARLDVAVFGTDPVTGLNAVAVLFGKGDGTFQPALETILRNIAGPPAVRCAVSQGDFNGDGKVDIAYLVGIGNSYPYLPAAVNVLMGKGDGTFSLPVTTSLPSQIPYRCLVPGDFNNDKKLDLAVEGDDQVFMMLGNDDGTFQAPVSVASGVNSVVVADLNGDGNLDLVGAQFNSPGSNGLPSPIPTNISVFLGDGTGHFPTVHSYTGQGTETFELMAVNDLNGDGHPDIAYLAGTPQIVFPNPATTRIMTINILLNNGDGTFTPGKTYNAGSQSPAGLVAAPLGSSKKVDLAFSNADGGISVLLGNGDGTFRGNPVVQASGSDAQLGDFNGDGKPDLILADSPPPARYYPVAPEVLLGNGDGTFTVAPTGQYGRFSCSILPGSFAIGDYNQDGKLDLAGPASSDIDVCLGNGDGTFTIGGDYFDQEVQHTFALPADFNNDGKLDLAASDLGGFSILLGNGDGTFQNGIATGAKTPNSFPIFAVGDFNNDGKQDVAVLTSPGIAVYLGNGDGTFSGPIVTPGAKSGPVTVTDLNKDGKADLIVVANNGTFTVSLGNGDGTFQPPVAYAVKGGPTNHAAIADFNLDGNLDVAIGTLNAGVAVFFGDGTGKLSATPTTFRVGDPITALVTADFNGDKKPDLAVLLKDGLVVTLLNQ